MLTDPPSPLLPPALAVDPVPDVNPVPDRDQAADGERAPDTDRAAGIDIRNFRDVGGHPTRDGGRLRRGLLYRSTDLARLEPATAEALADLGIRTVFDLRTQAERELWPEVDRLPPTVDYVVADVLADAPDGTPAQFLPLLSDPRLIRERFGGGRSDRLFLGRYREFINLASARCAYHRFLSDLAAAGRLPAVVHCTTGKDRTGWAVAMLQLLLGVAEADVVTDYLASNLEMAPLHRELAERFGLGDDLELVAPMMTVRAAYLDAALDEMRRGFGTLDGYIEAGLAIGPATRRRLVETFVEVAA
ncbi:MAG: tyrosine-protein phosphatase [Chloroflexota bacterium]